MVRNAPRDQPVGIGAAERLKGACEARSRSLGLFGAEPRLARADDGLSESCEASLGRGIEGQRKRLSPGANHRRKCVVPSREIFSPFRR
jgi:hypothetical protein